MDHLNFLFGHVTLDYLLEINSPEDLIDRKIAYDYSGDIPEYTSEKILTLSPEYLDQFARALSFPKNQELTNSRLLNILTHLGAIKTLSETHTESTELNQNLVFVTAEQYLGDIYSFDSNSTPYSKEIIQFYDEHQKNRNDHDYTESDQMIDMIVTLTVNFIGSGYDEPDDEEELMDYLEQFRKLTGIPIQKREDLGTWIEVKQPYQNVRYSIHL